MQFETEKAFIRDEAQGKKKNPPGIYHKTSENSPFLNRKKFVKCVTKHKPTSIQNTFLVIIHSIVVSLSVKCNFKYFELFCPKS